MSILAATSITPAMGSGREAAVIRGGYISAVPCIPTHVTPTAPPNDEPFTCVGSSNWDGDLTGVTMFSINGRTNLITGDTAGLIDETFRGAYAKTKDAGTLHFRERYVQNGASGALYIDAAVVDGSGYFSGARGDVVFGGYGSSVGTGHGGYDGVLCIPTRGSPCEPSASYHPSLPMKSARYPTFFQGGWLAHAPCVFTSLSPTAPPTAQPFTCVGSSTWDGALTGISYYKVTGTSNLNTGDVQGTIDETLTGLFAETKQTGTIHVAEMFGQDGTSGAEFVHARVIDATGFFQGARGQIEFFGLSTPTGNGHGGYVGSLCIPALGSKCS